MLKIKISFFVLLLVGANKMYCQNTNQNKGVEIAHMQFQAKQVIPPSPEAAELGKYGNVPVSLFTGSPNVSIPLTELKGTVLSLPVSLSYSASGFKPEDLSPWTGLGWALNAGGVITRSVAGNPDKTENYFTNPSPMIIPGTQDEFARQSYYLDVRNKLKETQPDMYYYNFMGHSGKFLLQPNGQIFNKEKNMLQISSTVHTDNLLNSFTIIDENGTKYEFTEREKTNMHDVDDGEGAPPMIDYNFNSAWYLSKVESAYGAEELLFEYWSPTDPQQMFNGAISNKAESYTVSQTTSSAVLFNNWIVNANATESTPPAVSIWKKFIKKITHKKAGAITSFIEFESAVDEREDLWYADFSGERLLKNVKLYTQENELTAMVKNYELSYSYSASSGTHGEKRLLLQSVQEKSMNSTTPDKPAYLFSYSSSGANIPPRFSSALDHWGFYNGVENVNGNGQPTLIPTINVSCCTNQGLYGPRGNGANREPDFDASNLFMINKITYPTGGYTSFEFEGHDAIEENGTTYHHVGGIRIKRIVDYGFIDKPAIVKNYEYKKEDGSTSGKIGQANIRYDDYSSNKIYQCAFGNVPALTESYTVTIAANSIYGLGSVQGSHIGYERVTETQTDLLTGEPLGKTVYNYKTTFYSEVDDDISNGDLIKQEIYRNDGKLLQESMTEYGYTNNPVPIIRRKLRPLPDQSNAATLCLTSNGIIEYQYPNPCLGNESCVMSMEVKTRYLVDDYAINMQRKDLVKQTSKIYDQLSNKYLTSIKNYTYSNAEHTYPTLIDEITNNGDRVKTAIKYVADYTATSGATFGTIAENIYQMQQKNQKGLPIEKLQFRTDANGDHTKYIGGQITDYIFGNPSKIYILEVKPLLTTLEPSKITSNVFMFDNHYRLAGAFSYDNLMNVTEQSKTGDAVKSYIWDYNKIYPVAEINGAVSTEVAYTSFEANSKGGFIFSGTPTVETSFVPTGKSDYNLSGFPITRTINPLEEYIVSYWSNSASGACTVNGNIVEVKQGATKNDWTYYEHRVSGVSNLTISGSQIIDELRLYPAIAQMSTITYDPLIGVTSQTDINNHSTYYTYDGLSRLMYVKDDDLNILKSFSYNYGLGDAPAISAQTLFYNAALEEPYIKQGCPVGTYPDTITYKIPYGKYVGTNQESADQKALDEKVAHGQNYANSTGLCWYHNEFKRGDFPKTNCVEGQGPGLLSWYNVYPGTFKSVVSQADANSMALADISAHGQAWVNEHGSCTCEIEGQRYNGTTCEEGTLICNGCDEQPVASGPNAGLYRCVYYYTFLQGPPSGPYYRYSAGRCPDNN